MKRELDRLQEGFAQVAHYESDQKFYPVPQLYRNRTSLGIWFPMGSRHGTSPRRGRFAPLVIDELSMGPFRFQHLFLTGVTPNPALLHEEPQTQIYYRFKAAYFHASIMFDPELILVGEKYKWRGLDLDPSADIRMSEMFALDLGFDLGPFSLQIYPIVAGNIAMRVGNQFFGHVPNLWRLGPRFTFRRMEGELIVGYSSMEGMKHSYGRLNVSGWIHRRAHLSGSLIYRKTNAQPYWVDRIEYNPKAPMNESDYHFPGGVIFTTWVGALQSLIPIGHRFTFALAASLERFHATYGQLEPITVQHTCPKASGFVSFTF
jgi:hypothetical protein